MDASRGNRAKGEIAFREKQFDQGMELFQKALEANPKSYEALSQMAAMHLFEKWRDPAKAEQYAQKAIAIDPSRALAYGLLAQAKVWGDKWNELDQVLGQAEKTVPDDFLYYYRAGRSLLNNGKDNARAEKYFRKFLTQEPEVAAQRWLRDIGNSA